MASAGRILIMPKGNYNSGTTYEMLDLVNHNGKSWLAKKTSVGIEPSDANGEYWQNMFDITAESIGALNRETGGYVKGSIVIEKDWATMSLADSTERSVIMGKSPDTNVAYICNYLNGENNSNVMLLPETSNISEIFFIRNVVDGSVREYKIFGEHNIDLLNQYIDSRIAEKLNNN